MWLISFSATYYGIWKRGLNQIPLREQVRPFSLDYIGVTDGNFWDYVITGWLYGSGTERDSIILVGVTPDTLGTCVFIGGLPGADYQVFMNTDSTGPTYDTGFIYFRQGYDNLYGFDGIMPMKYTPSLGDFWEAWDTCLIPLNTRLPIGDVDGDMIVDSLWVSSSRSVVYSISSSNISVKISPLKYAAWASSLYSSYNIDSIVIWDYYRFVFTENFGKIEEHLDSERLRYYMFGYTIIDTTLGDLYHKVLSSFSVSEVKYENGGSYRYIYDITGRAYRALPNRKGVYFLVGDKTRKKVIVR